MSGTRDAVAAALTVRQALSAAECDEVLAAAAASEPAAGAIIPEAAGAARRSSTVVFLHPATAPPGLHDRLLSLVEAVNAAHFGFELDGVEALQVARYEVGGRYDLHMDLGPGPASRRKLSLTVQLSDPASYEGGALGFFGGWSAPRDRGGAVLFPSYLHHAVAPLTRGTRYSLVGWFTGPPFR